MSYPLANDSTCNRVAQFYKAVGVQPEMRVGSNKLVRVFQGAVTSPIVTCQENDSRTIETLHVKYHANDEKEFRLNVSVDPRNGRIDSSGDHQLPFLK